MTNKVLLDRLKKLNACFAAVEWIGDRDLETAWSECERPDWLLWLAGRSNIDTKLLVKIAVECAEDVLPNFEKQFPNNTRVRDCIATVKKWLLGKASLEDVESAARSAASAARSAAWSAESASSAARSAASAASAARSAAWSAERNAANAASAASAAANKKHLRTIRRIIPYAVIEKALR